MIPMPTPIVVLGGTGMLGTAVVRSLLQFGLPVRATARVVDEAPSDIRHHFVPFDAATDDVAALLADLGAGDYVVNCVGIIKPYIHDHDAAERRRAIAINSTLPYEIAEAASAGGFRVIQIATDCVYSGAKGLYDENDLFDPTDVYGKSKSLGEVPSENFLNLRCSVIGPEVKGKTSLLEWVLAHEPGSTFSGYTDHLWNGLTGQAFGRVAAGIITTGHELSGTFHVVPSGIVSKDELSRTILAAYGRTDVTVTPTATGHSIDRTLATVFPDVNARLWHDAGYTTIPTVEHMVYDLLRESPPIGEAP